MSLAGHPPPVHCRPDVPAALVDFEVDLPIGTGFGARPRRTHTLEVAPGAVVCFYTDGLVERRGASVDEGLDRLCRAITAGPADVVCATVMDTLLTESALSDDIAVVVLGRDAGEPAGQE